MELSIDHPHAGQNKLLDRLFAIPEHKARYLAIITELSTMSFTEARLSETLDQIEQALKVPLAAEAKAASARKEGRVGTGFGLGFGSGQFGQSMPPRKFIELRTKSVSSQLAGNSKGFEPKPLVFGFGPPPKGGDGPGNKAR